MVTWMTIICRAAKRRAVALFAMLFGAGVHDQLWTHFL